MALSSKKIRVSITPSKETVAEIDLLANQLHMSRSAVCNLLIVTSLESYKEILKLPKEKVEKFCELLD